MKVQARQLRLSLQKISATEMVRYLFYGGCTTAVNLAVFVLLRCKTGWNVRIANLVSILIAMVFAFVVNKWRVFRSVWDGWKQSLVELGQFGGMRGLSMLLEIVGTDVLIEYMHISDFNSKLVMQFIVIAVNYIISKFFVFRIRKSGGTA